MGGPAGHAAAPKAIAIRRHLAVAPTRSGPPCNPEPSRRKNSQPSAPAPAPVPRPAIEGKRRKAGGERRRPENLKQAQKKSEAIEITDKQLDQMIKELKSMDLEAPSQNQGVQEHTESRGQTQSVADHLHVSHVGSASPSSRSQKLGAEKRKVGEDSGLGKHGGTDSS